MTDSALRTDFEASGAGRITWLLIPNVQAKATLCLPLPRLYKVLQMAFRVTLAFLVAQLVKNPPARWETWV